MVVRYDDGNAPEKIDTRFSIPQGGESRVIDLPGGKRKLKSIEFWYDTHGVLNGRADVKIFGMKLNSRPGIKGGIIFVFSSISA